MKPVTDPALLAQLNGGQSQQSGAPQGLRPVEDPAILAQLNGQQNSPSPQQQSGPSPEQLDRARFVPDPVGRFAATLMESGRNLVNIPNKINPKVFAPLADPNRNYYHEMGVEKNMGDSIAGGLIDFLPFMKGANLTKTALAESPAIAKAISSYALKNPKLAKFLGGGAENALAGGAYGAVNSTEGNRLEDALMGAGTGAAASVGGEALNALGRYGAKHYAQSAIPKFTEKATEKIRDLLPTSEYAKKLTDKYLAAVGLNKANWKGLEKTAENLDKNVLRRTSEVGKEGITPNAKTLKEVESQYFNQSPYNDYISKFNEKVKGLEPAMQLPYKQAIGVAEKAGEMAPESFAGAVAARKNINQGIKDYLSDGGKAINPANRESTQFLTGLKNTIKEDLLNANKDKIGEKALEGFKNQWELANKSHQAVQEFYKSFQNSASLVKPTRQMRERFQNAYDADPNIIGKFMPSLTERGSQGISGFQHLEKLMGSKKDAQEAAKSFLFKKQIENGANTVDAAAQYAKLSSPQKKWLFGNSEEGKYLDAINRTRLAFNREPAKTAEGMGINRHLAGMGVPALLGFGGSYYSGDSWDKSLLHGVEAGLAAKLAGSAAGRFATPKSVDRAIAMKNAQPFNGRYLNLAAQNLINEQQKDHS